MSLAHISEEEVLRRIRSKWKVALHLADSEAELSTGHRQSAFVSNVTVTVEERSRVFVWKRDV